MSSAPSAVSDEELASQHDILSQDLELSAEATGGVDPSSDTFSEDYAEDDELNFAVELLLSELEANNIPDTPAHWYSDGDWQCADIVKGALQSYPVMETSLRLLGWTGAGFDSEADYRLLCRRLRQLLRVGERRYEQDKVAAAEPAPAAALQPRRRTGQLSMNAFTTRSLVSGAFGKVFSSIGPTASFPCAQCDKNCSSRNALTSHAKTHKHQPFQKRAILTGTVKIVPPGESTPFHAGKTPLSSTSTTPVLEMLEIDDDDAVDPDPDQRAAKRPRARRWLKREDKLAIVDHHHLLKEAGSTSNPKHDTVMWARSK